MCILATISAVNNNVTVVSQMNVRYWKNEYRSKVLGVLHDTEARDINAHRRINLRTHN